MESAYYSHTNELDPTTLAAAQLRRAEIDFWQAQLPQLDADFELATQRLYSATGTAQGRIARILLALHRLSELPLTKQLQSTHCVLDLDRLIALDESLSKLGEPLPDVLSRLDSLIARYLTPSRPNQAPPTKANLKRRINDFINAENDTPVLENPRRRPRYRTAPLGNNMSEVHLEVDSGTAAQVDGHIRAVATREGISLPEAMVRLLTGEAEPENSVVIHGYRAQDVPNAPTFIQGQGWVDSTHVPDGAHRTVDPYFSSPRYITPENLRKFVEGRDGTCRYPGCNRRAEFCQTDHRINFSEGGPTAAFNLACLCQHHHNIKTDGTATYVMDPFTGDIVWLFDDGTWKATEPTGPLAPKDKHWVQTFAQAVSARRRLLQAEAQEAPPVAPNQEEPPF